ncbi:MAG: TrmH family RNA methyltransferase [Flavonifractor plautii]
MERITSRQNPLITRLRRLGAEKKTRRAQGYSSAKGPSWWGRPCGWGPPPELLAVAEGTAPPAELPAGVRVVEVPEALLRAVSTVETPQGMLAVCRTPDTAPPETLPEGRLLVLDGVQDPGNVGTVWRTADAFGAAGLFLLPGCAEPFAPKTVRATMGACFRLPVWEGTLEDLTGLLARSAVSLYAAALRDDTGGSSGSVPGQRRRGHRQRGAGVSQPVLDACRATLKIPMRDRCESLNAAVAASVVLWGGAGARPPEPTAPLRWDRALARHRTRQQPEGQSRGCVSRIAWLTT